MSTPTDVVLADIQTRLKALETKAAADASSVWAWVKSNWPHFVTWLGVAWGVFKTL